jgi:hypothetical protein
MTRSIRSLTAALFLATGLAHLARAQRQLGIEHVISWLPPNTETLIVAHGPIALADTLEGEQIPLARVLAKMVSTGPLPSDKLNPILQRLRDARVQFAVEGARHFRAPQALGLAPYEGCHITVFENTDVPKIDAFLRDPGAASDGLAKIAGANALRLRWRSEHDDWVAFIVRPRPNVVIVSTGQEMLEEVLERANGATSGRALPSNIEEWSRVDTTARAWAIRHYAHANNDDDPTSPITSQERAANVSDTLAIGITISVASDTGGVVANYLSRNPEAERIVRQTWASNGLEPSLVAGPQGVRIAVRWTSETREVLAILVLGVLGHAIYL